MKLLGDRVLLTRVEEEKKEGFETVEVQDCFVYKGKVEQIGEGCEGQPLLSTPLVHNFAVGDVVLFSKYSPDTQTFKENGVEYKAVKLEDIICVL